MVFIYFTIFDYFNMAYKGTEIGFLKKNTVKY